MVFYTLAAISFAGAGFISTITTGNVLLIVFAFHNYSVFLINRK